MEGAMAALVARLLESGYARPEEIVGCTLAEVAEVEARRGLPLPATYRDFLLAMGRGAGQFLVGTDIFYPTVLSLHQWAEDLLEDCGRPFALPADAIVYLSHQGYQFGYFQAGDGEDPPTYHYLEGDAAPTLSAPSFSAFLALVLESELAH